MNNSYINERRTMPVAIPIAQTNTLCGTVSEVKTISEALQSKIEAISYENKELYYLARLMFIGCLRISEVLSIKGTDITNTYHIKIKGSKNSNNKVVSCFELKSYLSTYKGHSIYLFNQFNRFYVYREFKKYGICFKSVNSSKQSVTHAIRHITSAEINDNSNDIDFKQILLGHKKQSNSKLYGHE